MWFAEPVMVHFAPLVARWGEPKLLPNFHTVLPVLYQFNVPGPAFDTNVLLGVELRHEEVEPKPVLRMILQRALQLPFR